MTLPTFLVVMFLLNGQVHTEVAQAPSLEICLAVQKEAKAILVNTIKQEPEAFAATCLTLKPVFKEI